VTVRAPTSRHGAPPSVETCACFLTPNSSTTRIRRGGVDRRPAEVEEICRRIYPIACCVTLYPCRIGLAKVRRRFDAHPRVEG